MTEGDRTKSIFGVDGVLTVVVEKSGVENVKEREVLEVAVVEMESRCADSINRKAAADTVSSLSSERPLRVVLNAVSDGLSVPREVLGSEILAEEGRIVRQTQRKFELINGMRCAVINSVRVKRRAKSKIRNVTWAVIRIGDSD